MLLFSWAFITIVFAIIYLFQILHLSIIGLQIVGLLLLILGFYYSENGDYSRIIAMNIIMSFVLTILYFSDHIFTYFRHGRDLESVIIVSISYLAIEAIGMFWGREFYKHHKENSGED